MSPHHCFHPTPFLGPWFPPPAQGGDPLPAGLPHQPRALLKDHEVVSNWCSAARDMGTCIFSGASTSPKQHNLCVPEQTFEECLGILFTKTLVISHV